MERKFGSNADTMILELRDTSDQFICLMANDKETLAFYGPQEGHTIHVRHISSCATKLSTRGKGTSDITLLSNI